ncbi:MAG: hypothetical protein R3208_04870 [Ketobacteraceae bacterium]|nr:hypothetical protein [Ketobacteraceae bacterium]
MDFSRGKLCILACLTPLVTACGGGASDDTLGRAGSGGSVAEDTYEGLTDEARLTQSNLNRFLIALFGDRGLTGLPEAFLFESALETLRNRIVSGGSTEFSQLIACFPGTVDVSAITNANTSFFNISALYSVCDETNATLDGSLNTNVSYNGSFAAGADKLSENLTYRDLEIQSGGSILEVDGEEELDFNLLDDSREVEKEITITDRDSDDQFYYNGITVELDDSGPFPTNLEELSGTYFDSENGFVTLSTLPSTRYSGNAVLVSGAIGSEILLDYEDQTDQVIITLDENGDGTAESTLSLTHSAFDQLVNP